MDEACCSFCGKPQMSVKKLIESPTTDCHICNDCIEICQFILNEGNNKRVSEAKLLVPTPREIKAILDDYIIGQEQAKKVMAVAVYNHYKRLNYNLNLKKDKSNVELEKSNILLIGPTGAGKTLIAKTLAKILKVPFACADATTLTEAGYVGDDVESVLTKLLISADYDIKKAERGIVYIDEIDKIAKKIDTRNQTRDVSGEGVQQALLKILEGNEVSIPSVGGRKFPHQEMITINTANILFICGGAFVKLDEIVQSRQNQSKLGFNAKEVVKDTLNRITIADLQSFGLIPEFVGRLPIIVTMDKLDRKALLNILTKPKNNLVEQYKTLFKMDGINLKVEESMLNKIVDKALLLNMGARGLRTVLEDEMLDIMYSCPSENLSEIRLGKNEVKKIEQKSKINSKIKSAES